MRIPDWVTDGLAIAATTIRRRVRRKRRHPRRFAVELAVLAALWLVVVVRYVDPGGAGGAAVGVPAAVQEALLSNVGDLLEGYLGVEVRPFARAVVAAAWLVLVNLRAASVTSSVDDLDVASVDLLSSSVRAVVLGETVAGNVRRLVRYGTHLVLGATVYALGGGSLATLPVSLFVLVVLQVSASLTGYVLGLGTWAWLLGGRRRWASRHVVGLPLRFGYPGFLVLVVFGYSPVPVDRLVAVGAAVPVGWTADLVLLELGGVESDPLVGLVVAAGLAAATLPLFETTQRLANRVWFADPAAGGGPLGGTTAVAADANRTVAERAVDALDRAVTPVVDRQTRAMAWRSWTLVLRNPGRVYLAAVPLVIALAEVANGANSGDASGPVIVAVAAGAVVCLAIVPSPFEFDSPVFPALLSAAVTGRQVVRAYLVTTSLLVLPLALVGAVIAGLFAPTPPVVLVGGVALTLALVPAGSALAVGASVAMPSTRLAAGRTTVSLDRYAMVVALAVVLLACVPAALVLALPALFEVAVGAAVTAAGLAASVCLAAASGAVAYRYAAREFDAITL